MIEIDKLLLKIVHSTDPALEEMVAKKESRVLRSLATSVEGKFFITENQARLLVKILKENAKNLTIFTEEIESSLENIYWSQKFRKIDQVKKLYIGRWNEDEPCLTIDFTFNSQIRKILSNLTKNVENLIQKTAGKTYQAELSEKNIVTLVEALTPLKFEIDSEVKDHYDTIKSWKKEEICDQFLITNISYPNFQRHITADLGIDTAIDANILKDRSIRYSFLLPTDEKPDDSLVKYLANRKFSRTWVDRKKYSLLEVFDALVSLRRFPVLVVFDNSSEIKTIESLETLKEVIDQTGFSDSVGVYFRLPNNDTGSQFNKIIADNKFNKKLDEDTKIVVVQSGKIPKFFLNNSWRPMSVITVDGNMGMRYGKTAVYTNCCDLIINYSSDAPILDKNVSLWQ